MKAIEARLSRLERLQAEQAPAVATGPYVNKPPMTEDQWRELRASFDEFFLDSGYAYRLADGTVEFTAEGAALFLPQGDSVETDGFSDFVG